MPFTDTQIKALSNKLSAKHVRTRQANGLTLSYIEGWHAIAEANRIFGHDAWDRQTMTVKCVWEGLWRGRNACSYIARVRVRVRAGDAEICREGCGSGHGTGLNPGEAHESAIKEAETDAMKRALTTFGNPFGLALYDKEQHNVRGKRVTRGQRRSEQAVSWVLLSAEGELVSIHEDPVDYCKALRQLLEATSTLDRLRALWQRNLATLAMLRQNLPMLKSDKDEHYTSILTSLYQRRLREIREEAPSLPNTAEKTETRPAYHQPEPPRANGTQGQIDKSALQIDAPRRLRDKAHLRHVAAQPCLICGRAPSHAHHLRFAQPRALGRKVSDEWAVPLCASHHRGLHDAGNEERWWKEQGIDPIGHAVRLWGKTRHGAPSQIDKTMLLRTATAVDKRDGTQNVANETSGKVPPLINARIVP